MQVNKEVSNDLISIQEDVAEYFTHENFPISGETYWTMVECIAQAKIKQIQGFIE
jgi:hypothetical protein